MKCIICDKKSDYILKGASYCKNHLLEVRWNDFYTIKELRKIQ